LHSFRLTSTRSTYNLYDTFKNYSFYQKLAYFIHQLRNGIVNSEKQEYYKDQLNPNNPNLEKYIEYLLIMIDRYISTDKSQMLAKLFIAFCDHEIT